MWKVAIIEDDRVDREIYKRCLQLSTAFEFDFAEAGSAAEGIEMSRKWLPDCILLDFHLPDMDGLEVLRRLRGDNEQPPCAIVMLTACGGEELAVNAMKSGAMDYLPERAGVGRGSGAHGSERHRAISNAAAHRGAESRDGAAVRGSTRTC